MFGIDIKRFNHALHFPVRILQMLRSIECVAHSLPIGINLLRNLFSSNLTLDELEMKNEIKLAEMKDLGEATKVKRRKAEEVTQD